MAFTDIKIRSFTGKHFKEFIPCIARLRSDIFREYPYLLERSIEEEKQRLKHYAEHHEAIAVLIFEGSTIVGASTGIPLIYEKKERQKILIEKQLNPAVIFHFDVSVLLKQYRGRGIGHHFFDLREEHVKALGSFQYTCFFDVDYSEYSSVKPSPDYLSLHHFWRQRGYVHHPDIVQHIDWKDHKEITGKKLSCWLKALCEYSLS
ncbi:MAG: GNAT family N-acetyltransferase [Chlamydiota bacterium]